MSSAGQGTCDSPQVITRADELCPAEQEAFDHFRACADNRGRSESDCLQEWLERHAIAWREQRLAKFLAAQRAEMERHKWLESEKANRDVGREALLEWISRHAASWRAAYEAEHGFVS